MGLFRFTLLSVLLSVFPVFSTKPKKFNCINWNDQWSPNFQYNTLDIGVMIDQSLYTLYDSNNAIEGFLGRMLNKTNEIFTEQFNIHFNLQKYYIPSTIPSYTIETKWWLDETCKLQRAQFTLFEEWKNSRWLSQISQCIELGYNSINIDDCEYLETIAAWLLISNCFPGNGVANRGRICRKGSSNVATINHNRESYTWLIISHELGHLLNADHYLSRGNGGIMDYGNKTFNGIHQFRDGSEICNAANYSRKNGKKFIKHCWGVF